MREYAPSVTFSCTDVVLPLEICKGIAMLSVLYGARKTYPPGRSVRKATPFESVVREIGASEMTLELMVVSAIGHLGTGIITFKGAETTLVKSWFENICTNSMPGLGSGASAGLMRSR